MSAAGRAGRRLKASIARSPLKAVAALTIFASLLFAIFPVLDLAVSGLFFQPGEKFPLAKVEILRDLRAIGGELPVTVAVIVAITLLLKVIYPSRPSLLPPRFAVYYLGLFLLGPLLIVNGVLKALWGRPRPVHLVDFGGSMSFTEAWAVGGQCLRNCSFVSGEAAAAACLVPLAFFVPRYWRGTVAFLIGALAAAISLNRIAFGAHFLSDVVIAWGLMLIVALGLRHIFYVSHAPVFANEALEARLTRAGMRLHETLDRWFYSRFGRWLHRLKSLNRRSVTQA